MLIREIMSHPVEIAVPDDSVTTAAKKMAALDCGALPVCEEDRVIGILTDRDIVTRAIAAGIDPDECYVREIMSGDVKYCYEDESVADLARSMKVLRVKRLPVIDRDKRLVGIVSLGDIAVTAGAAPQAQAALQGISQPGTRT